MQSSYNWSKLIQYPWLRIFLPNCVSTFNSLIIIKTRWSAPNLRVNSSGVLAQHVSETVSSKYQYNYWTLSELLKINCLPSILLPTRVLPFWFFTIIELEQRAPPLGVNSSGVLARRMSGIGTHQGTSRTRYLESVRMRCLISYKLNMQFLFDLMFYNQEMVHDFPG